MAKTILIVGSTGMLGNGLFSGLSQRPDLEVYGTTRELEGKKFFSPVENQRIIPFIDVLDQKNFEKVLAKIKPEVVINAIGLIKQNPNMGDSELAIRLNSLLPHELAKSCRKFKARLIHFSTDCVFSGLKGNYLETDFADAKDFYGKTKFLGEVSYPNSLTVRTSIIGHGLELQASLVDWFLAQKGPISGYQNVIYSGLPTTEWVNIIADYIIPNKKLSGLYHVSAEPISKLELLKLIAKMYGKNITIEPVNDPINDRSLNSNRFRKKTGYTPPSWPQLIKKMYQYYKKNNQFIRF